MRSCIRQHAPTGGAGAGAGVMGAKCKACLMCAEFDGVRPQWSSALDRWGMVNNSCYQTSQGVI